MSCSGCIEDCTTRRTVRDRLGQDRRRFGVKSRGSEHVVGLAGNPNTGKSTVFNRLTGLRQHTGNWPGKTVTRAEGRFRHDDEDFLLVDLPGTYSLLSQSQDERIARDFLFFGRPDVTAVVVDASALERNLGLVYQIFELSTSVVLCLNLMDEARRHGVEIDVDALSEQLGVTVVPTAARHGEGLDTLAQTLGAVARGEVPARPRRVTYPAALESAVQAVQRDLRSRFPFLPNLRWVALRLLDGDPEMAAAIDDGRLASMERLAHLAVDAPEKNATGGDGAGTAIQAT